MGKGSRLYVQPAELARKLVKEMEDRKVTRSAQVSVRNRYTVFLCPDDYGRLREREGQVVAKLQRHLVKHVRAKKYAVPGDITVGLEVDPDLTLGRFGILAELDAPGLLEQIAPVRAERVAAPRAQRVASDEAGEAAPARAKSSRAAMPETVAGSTRVIPAEDAAHLDLAWQTIVLRVGNREREFTKGRVIIGRAKDADFRVDDSNVSRRHAVIYWSDGEIKIEDLDSTNGTTLNGRQVSSALVCSGDVVVVGDCHITVDTR